MALFGRVLGTALLIGGAAVAVGVIVAAPKILSIARPTVREALRRGLGLYDKARAAAAEFADDVEDLVAEVRTEARGAGAAGDAPEKETKLA